MKNLSSASAVVVLLGTSVLGIGAAGASSYVSGLGGPTFAPDLSVNGVSHGMDTGFNVGVRYGYYFNYWNLPNLSVELDGLFSQSGYSNMSNSWLQSSSYMANAIYHLPTNSPLEFYGGAGLGAVTTNINIGASHNGSSTVLGWQALGGIEYRVSDQASIFAEYRYQSAHDVNAGGLT